MASQLDKSKGDDGAQADRNRRNPGGAQAAARGQAPLCSAEHNDGAQADRNRIIPGSQADVRGCKIDVTAAINMIAEEEACEDGGEHSKLYEGFEFYDDVSGKLVHPMVDDPRVGRSKAGKKAEWGRGDTYHKLTGDWRGNKSYYRSGFTREMSTANFNSSVINILASSMARKKL